MNALEAYRKTNKLTFEALAQKSGLYTSLVWKHCHNPRVPADAVPRYEATLGIPRWMLRPDLWPSPCPSPQNVPCPTGGMQHEAT